MFAYKEYTKEIAFFWLWNSILSEQSNFFRRAKIELDFYFDFDLWPGMNKTCNLKHGLIELDPNWESNLRNARPEENVFWLSCRLETWRSIELQAEWAA